MDLKSRRMKASLGDLDAVETLAFSPKGDLLVSGGMETKGLIVTGKLMFWNLGPQKK